MLANAGVQTLQRWMPDRVRQQAGSYRIEFARELTDAVGLAVTTPGTAERCLCGNPLVGAGLLANACVQTLQRWMPDRVRQQAGSCRFVSITRMIMGLHCARCQVA